jgi:alpha/beta superfamily hydrolase
MRHPLLHKITKKLVADGFSVLRFNFRGVGNSGGEWGGGDAELHDVTTAMEAARTEGGPAGLGGWSFGAATSLRWLASNGTAMPWVGIAPPVSGQLTLPLPGPGDLAPAPRLFILGDRDQFVTVEELRRYAASVGGEVECLPASDHFFYLREETVAKLVSAFLGRSLVAD